ncbi:MAG: sulfatase-like hydrolase/transferase [Bryobacterales bacterium]
MSRPNVLLISTDHWPSALMGEAGHRSVLTPTIDELARSGVRFTNAYGECPVCIPARRTLMTGASPRAHGDRDFGETKPMPNLPTMAQTFRDAGYQAYAVGKLHVYPQRNRIGFDDVILDEEGRTQYGVMDDYELFLGDQGYPGQQFDHGMSNNDYQTRPWHLPEAMHATNWATQQMVRTIKRRDQERPAFWYLSYRHPHPPLVPVQDYLDMYDGVDLGEPSIGEWTRGELPVLLQAVRARAAHMTPRQIALARKAFYALCTHIDHQLRVLISSLREEDVLSNTVICFTSDHGDMLGNHGMWAKKLFYEPAANIPMILTGAADDPRVGHHRTDDRIVGWQDVMPTLLDLAGIEIPSSVEGLSMVGERKREYLYGEVGEGGQAMRA